MEIPFTWISGCSLRAYYVSSRPERHQQAVVKAQCGRCRQEQPSQGQSAQLDPEPGTDQKDGQVQQQTRLQKVASGPSGAAKRVC